MPGTSRRRADHVRNWVTTEQYNQLCARGPYREVLRSVSEEDGRTVVLLRHVPTGEETFRSLRDPQTPPYAPAPAFEQLALMGTAPAPPAGSGR